MMGAVLFMYRVRHISNIPVSYCWLVSALAASDLLSGNRVNILEMGSISLNKPVTQI